MEIDRIIATYLIETPICPEKAALVLAGEQSTGTYIKVPTETEEIKEKFSAKVISVEVINEVNKPSLPDSLLSTSNTYKQAIVKISFPFENIGPSLPNLLSTIAGNLYELKEFSGLRLVDIKLPKLFSEKYKGPKFGIEGTREITGIYGRPLIGTIIKPNIGLKPEEYRPIVRELALAGLDFIKDDELNGSPLFCPLEERIAVIMDEINLVAEQTGKKTMYAFNITGDIDELKKNHDLVLNYGGNCVMASINSIGFAGISYLRSFSELPIHGHRNQWGAMTRHPFLGMNFNVYQKLSRLVGVDHLHTSGLSSKFAESNETVIQSIKDCLAPSYGLKEVMPVLSSAQWAGSAYETYKEINSTDVLHLAGGGILAHPDGIKAGVKSMQLAWKDAVEGGSLNSSIKLYPEIKRAAETFL